MESLPGLIFKGAHPVCALWRVAHKAAPGMTVGSVSLSRFSSSQN